MQRQRHALLEPEERVPYNRYFEASPVYPPRFAQDWNRSYLLEPTAPRGAVVLLHGLTDSPYSLRHVAHRYAELGFVAIGIRMPGPARCPLVSPTCAGRTGWRPLGSRPRGAAARPCPAPLHFVGFSNGGALAVKYALDAMEDRSCRVPTA